jgi:hypothetical protein
MQLGPVCEREAHIGKNVGFGLVHQTGELVRLGRI